MAPSMGGTSGPQLITENNESRTVLLTLYIRSTSEGESCVTAGSSVNGRFFLYTVKRSSVACSENVVYSFTL